MKKFRKMLAMTLALCMIWSCTAVSATDGSVSTPIIEATAIPTEASIAAPTSEPTEEPVPASVDAPETFTAAPTAKPAVTETVEQEATATVEPTEDATAEPTTDAMGEPVESETSEPVVNVTVEPDATATVEPTDAATATVEPTTTEEPAATSTAEPTATPTVEPSATVMVEPTVEPTPTMSVINDIPMLLENVQAVQAMIDALPDASVLNGMAQEDALDLYNQTQSVYDEYMNLSTEDQTMVDVEKIEALFNAFNSYVAPITLSNSSTSLSIQGASGLTYSGEAQQLLSSFEYSVDSGISPVFKVEIIEPSGLVKVQTYKDSDLSIMGNTLGTDAGLYHITVHMYDAEGHVLGTEGSFVSIAPQVLTDVNVQWPWANGMEYSDIGWMPFVTVDGYDEDVHYTVEYAPPADDVLLGEYTVTVNPTQNYIFEPVTGKVEVYTYLGIDDVHLTYDPDKSYTSGADFVEAIENGWGMWYVGSSRPEISVPVLLDANFPIQDVGEYRMQVELTEPNGYRLHSGEFKVVINPIKLELKIEVSGTTIPAGGTASDAAALITRVYAQTPDGSKTFDLDRSQYSISAIYHGFYDLAGICVYAEGSSTFEEGRYVLDDDTRSNDVSITFRTTEMKLSSNSYTYNGTEQSLLNFTSVITGEYEVEYKVSVNDGEVKSYATSDTASAGTCARDVGTYVVKVDMVDKVTGAILETATATTIITPAPTVIWQNDDGEELEKDENVPYGEMPSYDGETPQKAADAQYTYTFAGWTPEVVVVNGDATYTATYTSALNKYTVEWVNEADEVVYTEEVVYGENVQGVPAVPAKVGYTGAWDHDGKSITADTTIRAAYTVNQYTITFDTAGGSEIASITQDYGTPVIAPVNPTKSGCIFGGWDQEIPTIMPAENMTITARWKCNLVYKVGDTVVYETEYEVGLALPNPDDIASETIPENYYGVKLPDDAPTVMPAEDTVIECQWTVYLALLNEDGETLSFQKVALGEDVTANYSGTYYKAEHEFWLVNVADDTERYTLRYESGMPVWPTIPMDQNKTFRATFVPIPKTFEVTLHNLFSDLCTVGIDKNTATEGEELMVTLSPPENSRFHITSVKVADTIIQGYTFENNVLTIPSEQVTGNVTISGVACVSFAMEANGGKVIAEKDNDYVLTDTSVTMPLAPYGATITITSDVLAIYFERNGHTAIGLNTKPDGSGTHYGLGANFTLNADTVLYVIWEENSHTYSVNITSEMENGTVTADKATAASGETVTLTVAPNTGCELVSLTVGDENVTADIVDGTYSFTMPAGDVSITATFNMLWKIESDILYVYTTLNSLPEGQYSAICVEDGGELAAGVSTDLNVTNKGTISGGEFSGTVSNQGSISGAKFTGNASVTGTAPTTVIHSVNGTDTVLNYDAYLAYELRNPSDGKAWYCENTPADLIDTVPLIYTAYSAKTIYSIAVNAAENGTVTADKSTAAKGETVTLSISPASGYELETLRVTYGTGTFEIVENNQFTMEEGDVTVEATFKRISYDIVTVTENGSVTAPQTMQWGETVQLTVTPDEGYELDSIYVNKKGEVGATVDVEADNTFIMPTSDVIVCATFKAKTSYNITVASDIQNGTVTADVYSATAGTSVTLTATANDDYYLAGISVADVSGNICPITYVSDPETDEITGYVFTMPESNVTVTAQFARGDGHAVRVIKTYNGSVSVSKETAAIGEKITFTVAPNEGYELDMLDVRDEVGEEVSVRFVTEPDTGESYYQFTMPAGEVFITAMFKILAMEPSYIVTIPAALNLNDASSMTITAYVENLGDNELVVDVTSANNYRLVNGENAISYQVVVQRFTFTQNDSFDLQLTVGDTTGLPAGTYEDTLTFTASVQESASAGN